ncbi:hypothetical protein MRB53_035170 [Persea americana]|uniref:Uncharacterized protein n=1 Tax=Persea americana TaxID=3435 RepID=A0ACC2K447_PERAE|nr:hypothetical protein MRB53_035170 [Persea americana]
MLFQLNDRLAKCAGDGGIGIAHNPRGGRLLASVTSSYPSLPTLLPGDLVNLGLARVSMCLLATAPASSRIVGAKGLHVSSEIFLLNCSGCPMSSATYGWR